MPTSILDYIKNLGAAALQRVVVPVFAVDDSPPTLVDGETRPGRLNKANGGFVVHVANPSGATQESFDAAHGPLGGWTDHARIEVSNNPAAPTQLPSAVCSQVRLFADPGNTQPLYVGGSAVAVLNSQDMLKREFNSEDRMNNANEIYLLVAPGITGQYIRYATR